MAKTEVFNVQEQIVALTQIVQLMVKQQGQIIEHLKVQNNYIKSIDEKVKEMLEPVLLTDEDLKIVNKLSEV